MTTITPDTTRHSFYDKRGYLKEDFRLFHLHDVGQQEFSFHYHEFDKIILFLSGSVDYLIEGRSYKLRPCDIVLVNHHEIHRPLIDRSVPYERIIVYLSPDFLAGVPAVGSPSARMPWKATAHSASTAFGNDDSSMAVPSETSSSRNSLSLCFEEARRTQSHVLRLHDPAGHPLFDAISRLESAAEEKAFAGELYCRALFLEFLVLLNRAFLSRDLDYPDTSVSDERVLSIIDYIQEHLEEVLNADVLAEQFHFSRYHLMRLFRRQTGCSLGRYITSKRLTAAREYLKTAMPVTEICYRCGFQNYSTFSRAYRTEFGESPRDTRRDLSGEHRAADAK